MKRVFIMKDGALDRTINFILGRCEKAERRGGAFLKAEEGTWRRLEVLFCDRLFPVVEDGVKRK